MVKNNLAYRSYTIGGRQVLALYELAHNRFSLLEDDAALAIEMKLRGRPSDEIISFFVGKYGENVKAELSEFIESWEKNFELGSQADSIEREQFLCPPFGKGESAEDKFFNRCSEGHILGVLNCELTYVCSQRCVHCYNPHHRPDAEMETELWCHIIDQAANLGVLRMVLSGGECTCRTDFWEILNYARYRNMAVTVQSNGLYFDSEEKMERLAAMFPRSYEVSVYGATPETHDKITTIKGSWERTIKSLKLAKKYNIPIAIKSPVMTLNYHEIEQVGALAKSLGAGQQMDICITAQNDGGRNPLKLRVEDPKNLTSLIENENLPLYLGMEKLSRQQVIKRPLDGALCGAGSNSLCISPSGDVNACGSLIHPLGNLKVDKLKDIWEGNRLKNFRDLKLRDKEHCAACELNGYCSMCPGLSLSESGSIFLPGKFDCLCAEVRRTVLERKFNAPRNENGVIQH